jgi:phosphatidylserine/phosphatidylglycerophosphate/cardiolipin synthase-like enzyme
MRPIPSKSSSSSNGSRGYSFKYARELLAPLHRSMSTHALDVRFFVHIPQVDSHGIADIQAHVEHHLGAWLAESWPFGEPRPRLYFDKRALVPGPPYSSLHAKCVVVDGAKAFVTSANFTQRAQERNIEVGVIVDDPNFSGYLARQWLGLIEADCVKEYRFQ